MPRKRSRRRRSRSRKTKRRRRSRRRRPVTRSMSRKKRKRSRSRTQRDPYNLRSRFITIQHLYDTAGDKPKGAKSWAAVARKQIQQQGGQLLARCPVLTKRADGTWKPCRRGVQISGPRTHGSHIITGGQTGIVITCNHHNPKRSQHKDGGQAIGTDMRIKRGDVPRCLAVMAVSGIPPNTPFSKANRKGRRLSKSFFSP